MSCVAPRGAFYAMPKVTLPPGKTDEDYVLGLLRAKGILCVYGSGFGTAPEDGFFRVVFLASPAELGAIYDDVADFHARRSLAPDDSRAIVRYALALHRRSRSCCCGRSTRSAAQLLLLYVSALFATGLAPLVRMIERRRLRHRQAALPRAAAILVIYGTVLGLLAALAAAVVPPLVEQGQQLWNDLPTAPRPAAAEAGGVGPGAGGHVVCGAAEQAPAGSTDAVTTVLVALWSIVGGVFGLVTILLLTFYLLVDSRAIVQSVRPPVSACAAAARIERGRAGGGEDQRLARWPDPAGLHHRHHVGRRAGHAWACRTSSCWR